MTGGSLHHRPGSFANPIMKTTAPVTPPSARKTQGLVQDPPPSPPPIEFDQIQGNIFGGFNKDHAVFLTLRIKPDQLDAARKAFADAELFKDTKESTSDSVLRFNNQFRELKKAGVPEGTIEATWTNVVLTNSGIGKLGKGTLPVDASTALPEAFVQGMHQRAAKLGDVDDSAPGHWNDHMVADNIDWEKLDMMVIVASDNPLQLDEKAEGSRLKKYLDRFLMPDSGLEVFKLIRGETRKDAGDRQVGHEHFGFKDGVSQPGIIGVTSPDDPLGNSGQGNPGQDLLKPGEFVLGYARQAGTAKVKDGQEVPGLNPDDGPDSAEGMPAWVKNGSFLVFRRLAQDVKSFRTTVEKMAADLGTSADMLGAKLVGRYPSGAPIEALKYHAGMGEYRPPMLDPGIANPALADHDSLNNDFEYGDDKEGEIMPRSAHIRKAYPRNQIPKLEAAAAFQNPQPVLGADGKSITEAQAENRTQTHRLLRRGIPFGGSLGAPQGGETDAPRGLLFLAYQSDIHRQFEFVQTAWVNEPNFPVEGSGADPIITNNTPEGEMQACPFHQKAMAGECPIMMKHFVKTRGGAYFLSPSIDTLRLLLKASDQP